MCIRLDFDEGSLKTAFGLDPPPADQEGEQRDQLKRFINTYESGSKAPEPGRECTGGTGTRKR